LAFVLHHRTSDKRASSYLLHVPDVISSLYWIYGNARQGRDAGVPRGLGVGVALPFGVGVGVGVGDGAPPFAVQRIVPVSPTAMPLSASLAKEIIIEVGRGSACLVTPSNSGICCVQDCACQANGKSYVCCWKINALYGLIEK
jgi:hypothetical protein